MYSISNNVYTAQIIWPFDILELAVFVAHTVFQGPLDDHECTGGNSNMKLIKKH